LKPTADRRHLSLMTKPKLYYFDAPVSRGEECRLALHLAGVDFEDVRIKQADWPAQRASMPFGAVPVLELPGQPKLWQSNAILAYVGGEYGLHPKDPFEAARHEAMMASVEDLRHALAPSLRMADAEKKVAREALAKGYIPDWAANAEKQIGDGPFFGGAKINVVDLKIFLSVKFLTSGRLDHVPASLIDPFPKLKRVADAVAEHPGIKSWYARR
jgi:glutathione S-transferase